jgi:hypothetical protein
VKRFQAHSRSRSPVVASALRSRPSAAHPIDQLWIPRCGGNRIRNPWRVRVPALGGLGPCGKATCGLRRSTSSLKIQLHRVFRTPQRILPRRPALGSVVPRKTNLRILCGRAFENRTRFVVQRTKQTSSAVRTHCRRLLGTWGHGERWQCTRCLMAADHVRMAGPTRRFHDVRF